MSNDLLSRARELAKNLRYFGGVAAASIVDELVDCIATDPSGVDLRKELHRLHHDNRRLRRGDFTREELQQLCHNLSEDIERYDAFCDGCDSYQRVLFGKCRTDELQQRVTNLRNDLVEVCEHGSPF